MALIGLGNETLKLILFGGKGGVGKTTCASGTGFYLAQDFKTLIISTDPAHSIADGIGQAIGDEIQAVQGINNLSALEINAEKVLSQFKLLHEAEIKKILDTSTSLDQEDIDSLFSLSIPGIDEVMGFKTIVDLIEEAQFEKYIVDTAPTGHALRLLSSPQLLDDWIKVLAKMRWKYRYMVTTFAGQYTPDEGDDFLLSMKKTVKRINGLLRDSQKCQFIVVTIPEDMAILETERLIKHLTQFGIKVKQLVINNVLESEGCQFCRARKAAQQYYLDQIQKTFSGLQMTTISLQASEVKGIEALKQFKELLFQ
jgi:arsenite-transporting ATPase